MYKLKIILIFFILLLILFFKKPVLNIYKIKVFNKLNKKEIEGLKNLKKMNTDNDILYMNLKHNFLTKNDKIILLNEIGNKIKEHTMVKNKFNNMTYLKIFFNKYHSKYLRELDNEILNKKWNLIYLNTKGVSDEDLMLSLYISLHLLKNDGKLIIRDTKNSLFFNILEENGMEIVNSNTEYNYLEYRKI